MASLVGLRVASSACLAALAAQAVAAQPAAPGSAADLLWLKMGAEIRQVEQALDGVLGVAIRDLSDGREFLLNGDLVLPTASTIKLAVLAELYRQNRQAENGTNGKVRLSDRYVVRAEDRVPGSTIFNNLTPGQTTLSYRDLAIFMVVVSDNAATNLLIDRLGLENVNDLLSGLGLQRTRLRRKMMDLEAARQGRENVSSPRELVDLLQRIREGNLLGQVATDDYFSLLRAQKESDLPRDIPEAVVIANKPGALPGVRCDAGIVEVPRRPFAIAVMTAMLQDDRAGSEAVAKVAGIAYRYFERLGAGSVHGRYLEDRPSH